MDRTLRSFRRGKRQVDRLGRQPAVELGALERSLAPGDGVGDRLAQRMDLRRPGRAGLGVHRAERFELRRDLAGLAEQRHPHRVELGQVFRCCDAVEHGVGHGQRLSRADAKIAKACYSRGA